LSLGVLKALFTRNEPIGREERRMIFKKLRNAVAPSAQPFRMMGKSFPGRGSGPRLTDRKHYK
jgi:hypothetical protein